MCIRHTPFTLTEIMISSGLMVLLLACTVPFMVNAARVNAASALESRMRTEKYSTLEQLKRDLQTSAPGYILHSPRDGTAPRAISLPVLRRSPDELGACPVGADGKIQWSETVVYHVFETAASPGQYELRRTVFRPRDNTLSLADQLLQLDDVLAKGLGQGTIGGDTASTRAMLKGVVDYEFKLDPTETDGYAPQVVRQQVSLGTFVLRPGAHQFRFLVNGRNTQSTGYGLDLDSLIPGPAGSDIEAEFYTTDVTYSGPQPTFKDMSAYSGWSNNALLSFPATGTSQFVTFELTNDSWMESDFAVGDASVDDAEIRSDPLLADIVVRQSGNDTTWRAETQTGGLRTLDTNDYRATTARVLIAGKDPILGGSIQYAGRRGRVVFASSPGMGKLMLDAAYIMERASGCNGVDGTQRRLTFNGNQTTTIETNNVTRSDLFDLPLDPDRDYLVSFHINATVGYGYASVWPDASSRTHSYLVPNGSTALAGQASWQGLPAGAVAGVPQVVSVESVFATYPEASTYTSGIRDTKLDAPVYSEVEWRSATPSGTVAPVLRLRTGQQPDLSDAPDWDAVPLFTGGVASLSALPAKRYVQFQATFRGIAPFDQTAKLRDVVISWAGPEQAVEVSAAIRKGPDKGRFQLQVDGAPCMGATVRVSFHTRVELLHQPFEERLVVESQPRNP